jgi:hypothetical protein
MQLIKMTAYPIDESVECSRLIVIKPNDITYIYAKTIKEIDCTVVQHVAWDAPIVVQVHMTHFEQLWLTALTSQVHYIIDVDKATLC